MNAPRRLLPGMRVVDQAVTIAARLADLHGALGQSGIILVLNRPRAGLFRLMSAQPRRDCAK